MSKKQSARYRDAKRRRESGSFVAMPQLVLRSPQFNRLSGHAVKLLMGLLSQYRGNNNGDFAMAWTMMRDVGWVSRDTLNKARKELLDGGWIIVSRVGGRNRASLYAVTFFSVDYCGGKLDVQQTYSPSGVWHKGEPLAPLPKMKPLIRRAGQPTQH